MVLARIVSVNVGQPQLQPGSGGRAYATAIAKQPCAGRVAVGPLGLAGDAQADRARHGGPDQAVHAHFTRHLATWSALRGAALHPGDIGENLTLAAPAGATAEPDEAAFCIGDVVRAGTARLQVTQPRVPCYKQADRLALRGPGEDALDGVAVAKATGRTGFYFRVLEPGELAAGDELTLLMRPHPDLTVALVNRALHVDRDPAVRARIAGCAELGARLRAALT